MRRITKRQLVDELQATRDQTLSWIAALQTHQFIVPYIETLNPPLWELGHLAWFQEYWCCRQRHAFTQSTPYPKHQPNPSIRFDADALYDSAKVAHQLRWNLPLPNLTQTKQFCQQTLNRTLNALENTGESDDDLYFFRLALFHEKMHVEAFAYAWQALGYRAGSLGESIEQFNPLDASICVEPTDLSITQHTFLMGSQPNDGFVFDNEKWAHTVTLAPYRIQKQLVSYADFFDFVKDDGYSRRQFWDVDYFVQLQKEHRTMPIYWHFADTTNDTTNDIKAVKDRARLPGSAGPLRVWRFGQLQNVALNDPVTHVSYFEAQAFCKWAGRVLPTEAQWEFAANTQPSMVWGGQVCEWTSTLFEPYKGFEADPYLEYSEPWFGNHQVIKGTSFVTPLGLAKPQFRNFFTPQRNDIFVGFRTCALP